MTALHQYLTRIYATLYSRSEIDVKSLSFIQITNQAFISGKLYFYDGSFLRIEETVQLGDRTIIKLHYTYHYQKQGKTVFRYDNAPHHPGLPNFPHHKHIGDKVEPSEIPDLNDVLREVDSILYP